MLCAQAELDLGDDDSGLWELPKDAQVGLLIADYFNLNDKISIDATILGPQKRSIIACFLVSKNKTNATSVKLKQMQNANRM